MNVAVIGTGGWGKNLVRNFAEIGVLTALCDTNSDRLKELGEKYKIKQRFTKADDVFQSKEIRAVVIATPAVTHYELAKAAILAGKDVFLEKPLALEVSQAEELNKLVQEKETILMVDHLLQYHPALLKLKELIDEGRLGKLQYLYSNRLNIGKLRNEENILWSFAPHDISVILALTGKKPTAVHSFGEAYLQDKIVDTTITHLAFEDRLKAHIYVSWLHPFKEQKLVVIGNKAMAVFDDMEPKDKLSVYPHSVEWINQIPVAAKAEREIIAFDKKEPLREACLHFLECIKNRSQPRTDSKEAIEVLRVLQHAQKGLESQ